MLRAKSKAHSVENCINFIFILNQNPFPHALCQFKAENKAWRSNVSADFRLARWLTLLELRQEAHIVFKEFADVVNSIFEHRDAVNAHPEGKTGVAAGLIPDVFIQRRMNHS